MTKKKVDVIDLNNRPVSKSVNKESVEIDKRFVNIKPITPIQNKSNTIPMRNGRVYKNLGNGIGMYTDTGETFVL